MGNVNDGFLEPLTIENLAAGAFQKYAAGLAGFPLFGGQPLAGIPERIFARGPIPGISPLLKIGLDSL